MTVHSVPSRVALTLALPAVALLTSQLLGPWLDPAYEILFLTATVLTAWFCGLRYACAAFVVSLIVFDYFFLYPTNSLAIEGLHGVLRFLLFAGASAASIAVIHYAQRSRERLSQAELKYRSLAELIPFGGWTADANGNMLSLSESFLQTFGCNLEDCRGLGWTRLLDEPERDQVIADWQACMRSGYFWDYEYRLRSPAGTQHIVLSRGVPVRGIWVGIHLDITQRERDAEHRIEQARNLARFNAELEQFAYVSAHDLQEPLRMIASYLQLLSRRYKGKLDEDADTYINYAVEGAERLKALLQDLLELQQAGKTDRPRKPLRLADSVAQACRNLATSIGATNTRVQCSELPAVLADERSMVQLISQLLENAIKYRREEVPPMIQISSLWKNASFYEIRVEDNGIGIPPDLRTKIFEVFQRLHPRDQYPGTGIGLAICKKIVEAHGGEIWVESAASEGAVFCFTLPVHREQAT